MVSGELNSSLALRVPVRLFVLELPHLQDSFAEKLLQLMPRLSSCNPLELVKILQTTLRQSSLLQLALPEQVSAGAAPTSEELPASHPCDVVLFTVAADPQSNGHHHRTQRRVGQPAEVHVWAGLGSGHRCNAGTRAGPSEDGQGSGELDVVSIKSADLERSAKTIICFFRFFIPMARVM